jgi:hypothetical protein
MKTALGALEDVAHDLETMPVALREGEEDLEGVRFQALVLEREVYIDSYIRPNGGAAKDD